MCLTVDIDKSKALYLNSKKKTFTFYKAFRVVLNSEQKRILKAFYQNYEYQHNWGRFVEKDLTIPSHSSLDTILQYPKILGGVFHGYENASSFLDCTEGVRLKIKVKKEDFIAAGTSGDVCFKAFTLSRKEWEKARRKYVSLKSYVERHFSSVIRVKLLENSKRPLIFRKMLPSQFVTTCMLWSETKEGAYFWKNIYEKCRRKEGTEGKGY